MSKVNWRGVVLDSRSASMMDEVVRLVGGRSPVTPTQGSYSGGVSASAGTHDGCGAIDIAAANLSQDQRNLVRDCGRQVGWAMWIRNPSQSNWPWHIHGIAVQPGGKNDRGCLSSGAASQVVDYYNGLNGLAGKGADDGPRQWVGVTWESYCSQANKEEDDLTPDQDKILRDTFNRADWCWQYIQQVKTRLEQLDPVIRDTFNRSDWTWNAVKDDGK